MQCTRDRFGTVGTMVVALMLSLIAAMPMTVHGHPDQGQIRITLIIPERTPIVIPALQATREGLPALCNAHQGTALREIRHLDGHRRVEYCSDGVELAPATGRHAVLVTPI